MNTKQTAKRNTFYLINTKVTYFYLTESSVNPPDSTSVFVPVSFVLNQYPSISRLDPDLNKVDHLKKILLVDDQEIECLPLDCYSLIVSQMMFYEMSQQEVMISLADLVHKTLFAQVICEYSK